MGNSSQTKKHLVIPINPGYRERLFYKTSMINSLELAYKMKSSQAMLRIEITPMPFSKKEGPGNPFRAEFVYKLAQFN